jgi:Flp pilus assembly protein TadD
MRADDYGAALDSLRRAKELAPDKQNVLNNLAFLYLTAPDENLRAPEEALRLAKRVVDLVPGEPDYVGLLGWALHFNGHHKEAVKRLQEAIPAYTKPESESVNVDRLVLAMALWKLGKQGEARETLRTAEAWFAENESEWPGIRRFRAMAKEMIR